MRHFPGFHRAQIAFYLGSFEQKEELLKQLGKYKGGKGCVYIKTIADIHIDVLEKLISLSVTRRS